MAGCLAASAAVPAVLVEHRRADDRAGDRAVGGADPGPADPEGWCRFDPTATFEDPYLDAARSLMIIDTMGWPAFMASQTGAPPNSSAPTIELSARFHRPASRLGVAPRRDRVADRARRADREHRPGVGARTERSSRAAGSTCFAVRRRATELSVPPPAQRPVVASGLLRGCSSVGRALRSQRRGRRFESVHLHGVMSSPSHRTITRLLKWPVDGVRT